MKWNENKMYNVKDNNNINLNIRRNTIIINKHTITEHDDDEIAYFIVRWKTRELVLSTAPKTWDNNDKDSRNRKRSH